ncbi:MAG: sodium:calcium antiporter [Candidatus Micrarchaeia archaeon]|jgi:cation:H+ antiporter
MVLVQVTFLVVLLIILAFAAGRVVRGLIVLSEYYRLPKFLISFVVLGVGTSLPDIFIGVVSGARGAVDLVLGTVVGANIVVLCVILGVVTFLKGRLLVREKTVLDNFGWIFFVLLIPILLFFDGRLQVVDGAILVVVYLMYLYNVKEHQARFKYARGQTLLTDLSGGFVGGKGFGVGLEWANVVVFLVVVMLSSYLVVGQALELSAFFAVSPFLVGSSVVALGVTLPEMALGLNALRVREEEIIWGDLIGSVITDLTLVVGVAALFSPVSSGLVGFSQLLFPYGFMAACFLLVFLFAFRRNELTKAEALALMLLYVVFLSVQLDLAVAG